MSLDPPNFRRHNRDGTCSYSFDPLGAAVGPGAIIENGGLIRALVYEDTNHAGGTGTYFKGTRQDSVQLFAREATQPIITDTTGDGRCDDILDEESLQFQQLTHLEPTGTPWFGRGDTTAGETDALLDPPLANTGCTYGNQAKAPTPLCNGLSDLTTVVNHAISDEPVVYAVSPATSGPECMGSTWELPGLLGDPSYEGWVCLAVRAYDKLGNRGVSKPMPVCLDNVTIDGQPSCAMSSEPLPDCNDDCSDPPEMPARGIFYEQLL